jgi:hypothetical protein
MMVTEASVGEEGKVAEKIGAVGVGEIEMAEEGSDLGEHISAFPKRTLAPNQPLPKRSSRSKTSSESVGTKISFTSNVTLCPTTV